MTSITTDPPVHASGLSVNALNVPRPVSCFFIKHTHTHTHTYTHTYIHTYIHTHTHIHTYIHTHTHTHTHTQNAACFIFPLQLVIAG